MPPGTRSNSSGEVHTIDVDGSAGGMRLDLCIAARLDACSRSFAARLIATGHVTVSGHTASKPGYRLKPGDRVSVLIPPPTPVEAAPEPLELDIAYQDPQILVLNKQAGVVVHPAPGHAGGTLVNGLLYLCPDLGAIGGEIRPGIVHRLDKDTSGLLIVAKDAEAHRHLAAQFKARSVEKHYLALTLGRVSGDGGTIDLPIGRHPTDRKRMSTVSRKSRSAETRWRVAERFGGATLLEIELKTGRTHQIRVHCAAMGHPVVGDPVYGHRSGRLQRRAAGRSPSVAAGALAGAQRQMLHAWRLAVTHPLTGKRMTFESPLPDDMAQLLEKLRRG